jgi:gas vesicle protein
MSRNAVNRYFEGFLVGGAIGFVVGLLTAPKPGSELRRELADGADDLLNQMNTQLGDISELVSDKVQPLADKAVVLKDRVADRASTISTKVATQAGTIREKVSDRAQDLSQRAGELREKAVLLKDQAVDKAGQLKEQAMGLRDQAMEKVNDMKGSFDASAGESEAASNQELLDNYMGNNSGPMYTPGTKAGTNSTASSMGDAHSTYSPNKPEAAGG